MVWPKLAQGASNPILERSKRREAGGHSARARLPIRVPQGGSPADRVGPACVLDPAPPGRRAEAAGGDGGVGPDPQGCDQAAESDAAGGLGSYESQVGGMLKGDEGAPVGGGVGGGGGDVGAAGGRGQGAGGGGAELDHRPDRGSGSQAEAEELAAGRDSAGAGSGTPDWGAAVGGDEAGGVGRWSNSGGVAGGGSGGGAELGVVAAGIAQGAGGGRDRRGGGLWLCADRQLVVDARGTDGGGAGAATGPTGAAGRILTSVGGQATAAVGGTVRPCAAGGGLGVAAGLFGAAGYTADRLAVGHAEGLPTAVGCPAAVH